MKPKHCPVCGHKITVNLARRNKVAQLRKDGKTYKEIGKELGMSTQAAWLTVERIKASGVKSA
mgnify:CR=1 FL=1